MKKLLTFTFFYLPLVLYCQNVTFSENRGFYELAFQLSLSTDIPSGQIRYTTDGSVPSTT
ncbi:MAG: chitobiase/beta-hexosaminidase C-terminal domain-containing protein, partial [Bacteroidetes bacterium]|nr:chitobiase/beta-hexosaminidase C-terminal domain-containing protein [Bacteroidota bacterium]